MPDKVSSKADIPSAFYDTYVFSSKTRDGSQALFAELTKRFPFADRNAPTRMTAWSEGDAMRVSDAMRMALECEDLSYRERVDLALEMEAEGSWERCLALLPKWGLALQDGEFVDASAIEAASAGETHSGSTEGESATRKGDAQ